MIGVGIIGVGMVAGIHAKALGDLKDIAVVRGVYDRDQNRLDEYCTRWGFPKAASVEAMLADQSISMIIILTPPNARKELVAAAAAAGKHVLLEKPLERNAGAAKEMVDVAADRGVRLGVVFQHRFRDVSQKLQQMVEAQMFGTLATAQVVVPWWRPQSYYDEPGRGTYERDGGGVMINQAIHTLDLLQVFTGPVSEVCAIMGTTRLHQMEAEDFVAGGVRFASGAMGSIMATTAAFPGGAESIELGFERAAVHLESGVLTIRWHNGREETFGEAAGTGGGADPMAFPHDWHASAQRDFIEALRDGREPAVTGEIALGVHRLIDALSLSSREKRVVALTELGQ